MRIEDRTQTARGPDLTSMEVVLRHPGDAKVTTTRQVDGPIGEYEVWISDGELVRTYSGIHKLGTQRPIRNRPRGLADPDFPGSSQVYEPLTGLPFETLPDTFVHPAGFCQNVLATGRCRVSGTELVIGREAILVECDHPRTTEIAGARPRDGGHPAPGRVDRRWRDAPRRGRRPRPGRAAPAIRAAVRLPLRDDDALLTERSSSALPSARIVPTISSPTWQRRERRARERRAAVCRR
jgi:hypothetical protein